MTASWWEETEQRWPVCTEREVGPELKSTDAELCAHNYAQKHGRNKELEKTTARGSAQPQPHVRQGPDMHSRGWGEPLTCVFP